MKNVVVLLLLSLSMISCSALRPSTTARQESQHTNQLPPERFNKSLDDSDLLQLSQRLETQPLGEPSFWQNSQTSASYTVTATKNFTLNGNPYCRQYRLVETMGDESQETYGSACRQKVGVWLLY